MKKSLLFQLINSFYLKDEKEDELTVATAIENGVTFRGTNLWILVFAIFIASLGLNVNSTAVIIGAMLISPLMGPIMGIGFSMAVNDLHLLRKALYNWLFASAVGLITSTIYFSISPLNEAHSEILARTSPNIYDVLIALFGGLSGMLALSSKKKGNVIPGVAIATALMPPLCTAGYGLATWHLSYFSGALYLFLINTVFIALSTMAISRLLKMPYKQQPDAATEKKTIRIIWGVVIITVLPSIYFAYDIVQQNKFETQAELFISQEANFQNDYLLKKEIDPKGNTIILTYGGEYISKEQVKTLKNKLKNYSLNNVNLEIHQGFSYLQQTETDNQSDTQIKQLTLALTEKDQQLTKLQVKIDSIQNQQLISKQLFHELKTIYPQTNHFSYQHVNLYSDTSVSAVFQATVFSKTSIREKEKQQITAWLKTRTNQPKTIVLFETATK